MERRIRNDAIVEVRNGRTQLVAPFFVVDDRAVPLDNARLLEARGPIPDGPVGDADRLARLDGGLVPRVALEQLDGAAIDILL